MTIDLKARCARCHHAPPNPNGCATCSPEQLGERLTEALAQLEEARRELREALVAVRGMVPVVACERLAATARALAFEEAAQAIKHLSHEDGLGMGSLRMESEIRALATLPSTLVVAERADLAEMLSGLRRVDEVMALSKEMAESITHYRVKDAVEWLEKVK